MGLRRILMTVSWFAVALVWIVMVALNRGDEGWEWYFRMAFGLLLLALGTVTALARGGPGKELKERTGHWLTLSVMVVVVVYLAALVIQALAHGSLSAALVFSVFAFGMGSAVFTFLKAKWLGMRRIQTLATWCHQEYQARRGWTRELVQPRCFADYRPRRMVTEQEVYCGRIDKKAIHKVTDEELQRLPGIGTPEFKVLNRFLFVPRLPGIGMTVAQQVHQEGIYAPQDLERLTEEELQRFKGIGPKKARQIRRRLERILSETVRRS